MVWIFWIVSSGYNTYWWERPKEKLVSSKYFMGVLWIIFCSTTDKKKSKETIIKFYFQSWIFIKFIQKLKKNKNSQF